jgi:hypothetical protein
MADEVVVGNNIDMLSSTNKGFWIMLVDTPIHMVKKYFTNGWGKSGLKVIMSCKVYGMRGCAPYQVFLFTRGIPTCICILPFSCELPSL